MKQNDYYLPRCVTKKELKNYFGVSYKEMWNKIITEDLLNEWGYEIDDIKPMRLLTPEITKKIYIHFEIKDLNMDMYQELYAQARA